MVGARKQKLAAVNVYLLSRIAIVIRYIEVDFTFGLLDYVRYIEDFVISRFYCWFSHDVIKFQTSELLILLRFYFHDVLEQLKTNIQTNFHSEWVLGLVIDYA